MCYHVPSPTIALIRMGGQHVKVSRNQPLLVLPWLHHLIKLRLDPIRIPIRVDVVYKSGEAISVNAALVVRVRDGHAVKAATALNPDKDGGFYTQADHLIDGALKTALQEVFSDVDLTTPPADIRDFVQAGMGSYLLDLGLESLTLEISYEDCPKGHPFHVPPVEDTSDNSLDGPPPPSYNSESPLSD